MKNLKKVLSLVLVIALAFSFVTIAGAKFSDDADINYDTAVGVMTGIGAINGYTDGSFKPAGLVTRAEAAKMVTYAVLGPTVAAALATSTTSFSDVPATHWAAPYIEYCVTQGIVNGRGDGTFDPNGNVTGFEIAKMMLCAVGYGENNEYVGPSWAINVAKDAMPKGMFTGNETANFAVAATREEAALYIFNGIYKIAQVDYSELFGYYGKGTSVTNPGAGMTIAEELYKMTDMKGIVTGGSMTGAVAAGTYVDEATITAGKVTAFADDPTLFKYEATSADIGQLVAVYYNTTTMIPYYTETLSSTLFTFGASTPYTYSTLFGSADTTTADEFYVFTDSYADVDDTDTAANINDGIPDPFGVTLTVGSKAPMGIYAIYGGEIISYARFAEQHFVKVTAISTTAGAESITFSAPVGQLSNKASDDDVIEYEGIKVGDYVTVSKCGDIFSVGKTSTVDGKISEVNYLFGVNAGPTSVTMDGKVYNASSAAGEAGLTERFPTAAAEYANNTYTLYLDAMGNFITSVLKSGATASSVVYVTGAAWEAMGDFGSVYKVQAVNTAGEQVIFNSADGEDVDNAAIASGFYKVTIDSITNLATFDTDIADTDLAVPATPDTLTANEIKNGANYYYGSDVSFIFVSGYGANLKITKVTGLANVAGTALDASDMLFFNQTANSNKTVSTVIVTAAFSGATTAKTLYISSGTAYIGTNADGYQYNVYLDGVKTTVTAKNSDVSAIDGNFVNYTIDGNGIYEFGTAIGDAGNIYTDETVETDGIFNDYITTAADNTAKAASGVIVVDLYTSPFDPAVYTSVASMEAVTDSSEFTISYVLNTAGEIIVIYVTNVDDASK